MNCDFTLSEGDPCVAQCKVCGRRLPCRSCKPPIMRCRPGLGDMIAFGLDAVGITKQRVEALVGGPCGCAERQEDLNTLGRSLGIGRVDPPT